MKIRCMVQLVQTTQVDEQGHENIEHASLAKDEECRDRQQEANSVGEASIMTVYIEFHLYNIVLF